MSLMPSMFAFYKHMRVCWSDLEKVRSEVHKSTNPVPFRRNKQTRSECAESRTLYAHLSHVQGCQQQMVLDHIAEI